MKMILVSVLMLGATLSAFGQVSTRAIEEFLTLARRKTNSLLALEPRDKCVNSFGYKQP